MLNSVYIALGSNIGDRQYYLDEAIRILNDYDDVEVVCVSSYVDTEAVSLTPQPNYLNAVVEIKTLLGVREFFKLTVEIETRLGRQFKGTSDPRTLDIDLLFFNQEIISDDDLVVPHPLLHDRLFVLKPFQEIAPTLVHPILNETVRDLYEKIK